MFHRLRSTLSAARLLLQENKMDPKAFGCFIRKDIFRVADTATPRFPCGSCPVCTYTHGLLGHLDFFRAFRYWTDEGQLLRPLLIFGANED